MRYLWVWVIASLAMPLASADTSAAEPRAIAIVGTGEVGSALGTSWGGLGHPIIYGSRTPDSEHVRQLVSDSGNARAVASAAAAAFADVIVLALPFTAALELLPKMGSLDGKILIDPMNALAFDRGRQRISQSQDLLAEQLQRLAPGAHVVKAFSTLNAKKMRPDRDFDAPISVPVAGDDRAAKQVVIDLVTELGLDGADVGPLFNARYVEAMAPLYVYMNAYARPPGGFEFAFSRSGKTVSDAD
ncbi:MAG: NADPH-dependent F420 reductase [Gammaproteobacteria bacterium]